MSNKNVSAKVTVNSTQASERTEISNSENINSIVGKIRKWFSDLKPVAFSGSYNDLTDKPGGGETIPPIVINNVVDSYTKNKEFPLKINIDLNLIVNHPVRFDFTGGYRGSNSVLYLTYFQAIVLSSPYKGTIDANGKLVISESEIMGKANYTNINWSIIPVSDSYVNFYPSLNPWEDYVSIHIYIVVL